MTQQEIEIAGMRGFKAGVEYQKEQSYTEKDLQAAWRSSEQNMRFQFSSSAYKNVTFEQWLNSYTELTRNQNDNINVTNK